MQTKVIYDWDGEAIEVEEVPRSSETPVPLLEMRSGPWNWLDLPAAKMLREALENWITEQENI